MRMIPDEVEPTTVELMLRLRQQELVAGFGRFSLRHDDLQPILNEACKVAATGLSTRFAKVLQYLPASGDLLVRAGIGWHEGVVGHARLGGDLASPAGFAYKTGEPVLSNYLGNESRFNTPALLVEHGVHSAINVLIGDSMGAHYGVLEVDSTGRDAFTRHDMTFLETLANTVAEAVGKNRRIDDIRRSQELGRCLLEASPDGVQILTAEGLIEVANARCVGLSDRAGRKPSPGSAWLDLWPQADHPRLRDALDGASAGQTTQLQLATGTPDSQTWWDIIVAAVGGAPDGGTRLVAITRDITELMAIGVAKDALLREKDLLMQEVHHRVKNSLQMVQNLLSLQARAVSDDDTADVLRESAARVHTIGAIHDRLYREGGALDIQVGPYLQGLIDDLAEAMGSAELGRSVSLDADEATWPASAMPALGLVTTELLTNALKYGAGAIRVTFRHPEGGQGILTIEDDGTGLPPDFDPATSRGLGMRIVTGLLRPRAGGLDVMRDRPNTCFVATLPRNA